MGRIILNNNDELCNILVLHTGGTIGMSKNENEVLEPARNNQMFGRMKQLPQLCDEKYALDKGLNLADNQLVTPLIRDQYRFIYTLMEYCPLLDSSNMGSEEWIRIARDISTNYEQFDGFVVLHGTDTLCYTSSVLSFMLENLDKPVIITGAQITLFDPHNDGVNNFISALLFAGSLKISEVGVSFGNKLFRGNRVKKWSPESFDGFVSPNMGILAEIGTKISFKDLSTSWVHNDGPFSAKLTIDTSNIDLLYITPNLSDIHLNALLNSENIKGLVLMSFGAGNIPNNNENLINVLKELCDRGVIVVNVTQCFEGGVEKVYEAGLPLYEIGVLSGFDMTLEAAFTKLAFVLGNDEWDLGTKKEKMSENLRGELTEGNEEE